MVWNAHLWFGWSLPINETKLMLQQLQTASCTASAKSRVNFQFRNAKSWVNMMHGQISNYVSNLSSFMQVVSHKMITVTFQYPQIHSYIRIP